MHLSFPLLSEVTRGRGAERQTLGKQELKGMLGPGLCATSEKGGIEGVVVRWRDPPLPQKKKKQKRKEYIGTCRCHGCTSYSFIVVLVAICGQRRSGEAGEAKKRQRRSHRGEERNATARSLPVRVQGCAVCDGVCAIEILEGGCSRIGAWPAVPCKGERCSWRRGKQRFRP